MLHSGSLLAQLIPGTCVNASQLPYSVESSRLQDGFIACCWYNSRDTRPVRAAIQNHIIRGYCLGDGQSNDNGASALPTAVYWKFQRILKPSNLNGTSAVTSLSPCPPFSVHSSNLFIPTSPLVSQCTRPRTEVDAAALLLSCVCVGPLLQQLWAFYWRVISWIERWFQSIQQGATEAHSVLQGTLVQFSLCCQPMLEGN